MEYTVFPFVPAAPSPFPGYHRARLLYTLIRFIPSPNKQHLFRMNKRTKR